jgi:hypothetical protein
MPADSSIFIKFVASQPSCSELERNREKINSARGKASDFVGLTDSARKMLSSMENRDTQQKMVLGFIGVFLLISLILVIYFATQPTH